MTVLRVAIGINCFMILVLANSLVFGSPDPRRRKGLLIGIIVLFIPLITLNYFKFYGIKNKDVDNQKQTTSINLKNGEVLSNIAKNEAEEREAVKFPQKNKGSKK